MADVGGMGEHTFGHLCDEVDLVANLVQRDKTGWDYLVELRRGFGESSPLLPPELQAPLLSCRVQVKTTTQDRGYTDDVSLENWRRFAVGELPAFFMVFEYDGRVPTAAYLIHVGPELIRKTQEQVRKALGRDQTQLNRKTMRLRWGSEHRLREVSGSALRAALVETVGEPLEYYNKKREWNTSADVLVTEFSATMDRDMIAQEGGGDDLIDAIIDLGLGIRDSIPARVSELKTARHGVEIRYPKLVGGRSSIGLTNGPPMEPVQVAFASTDGSNRAVFDWNLISPARTFPFIPVDRLRVRYVGDGVDCIHNVKSGQLDFSFRFSLTDDIKPIGAWWALLKLFRIVEDAMEKGATMEVIFGKEHGFEAKFEVPPMDVELADTIKKAYFSVEAAVQVLQEFGVPLTEAVRVVDLQAVEARLRIVRGLLKSQELGLSMAITVDLEGDLPKQLATPIISGVPIGHALYLVVATLSGVVRVVGELNRGIGVRLEWPSPEIRILARKRRAIGLAQTIGIEELRTAAVAELESYPYPYVLDEHWPRAVKGRVN